MMNEQAAPGEEEAAGARKRKRGRGVKDGAAGAETEEEEEVEGKEGGGWFVNKGLLLNDDADAGERYEEAAVAEVMRWLQEPDAVPAPPDAAAGFVTINGNEESCGPSFSCAASTVMASVDTRAGAPPPPPLPWPLPEPAAEPPPAKKQQDDDEDEEAWLAELLLACGPALELQGV